MLIAAGSFHYQLTVVCVKNKREERIPVNLNYVPQFNVERRRNQ